jgi:hypothetical protein
MIVWGVLSVFYYCSNSVGSLCQHLKKKKLKKDTIQLSKSVVI